MTVERVILGPVGPGQVFQFDIGQAYPPAVQMPYQLLPGTVIVCEATDVSNNEPMTLSAYRLFLIKQLPTGAPMPTYTNFYATTAYTVGISQIPVLNDPQRFKTQNNEDCNLCELTGDGPIKTGLVQLSSAARIKADPGRIALTPSPRIMANSVFFIDMDSTHNVGPYLFTDHEIPLDHLEEEDETPNS